MIWLHLTTLVPACYGTPEVLRHALWLGLQDALLRAARLHACPVSVAGAMLALPTCSSRAAPAQEAHSCQARSEPGD